MKDFLLIIFLFTSVPVIAQTGIIWDAPITIATQSYGNMHPRITLDGAGDPLIIWGDMSSSAVYFSRWDGISFSMPVALNPATIPVFTASWAGPDLTSFGDTVYVTFKQTPEDVNPMYMIHSYDRGSSFSSPIQIDQIGDSLSRFPVVTVDDTGNPIVAFMKFDPGYLNARYVVSRSNDFGTTFSPDAPASGYSGGVVCDCCPASIVADSNTVAMLYRDNLNNLRNIWAGISNDGGNTFNVGLQIDNSNWIINACPSSGPDGVIIGDTLYSVFMSEATGTALVYMSKVSLSNFQSSSSIALTDTFASFESQNYPRIANSGNAVAMVWKQITDNGAETAFMFTPDIQNQNPVMFDSFGSDVVNADIILGSGYVHVVWEDGSTGTVQYQRGSYLTTLVTQPEINQSSLLVYPNPVQDMIHIKSNAGSLSTTNFSLYNITGNLIPVTTIIDDGEVMISTSGLPKGMYFLQCNNKSNSAIFYKIFLD
jgi:hypothetical protein